MIVKKKLYVIVEKITRQKIVYVKPVNVKKEIPDMPASAKNRTNFPRTVIARRVPVNAKKTQSLASATAIRMFVIVLQT